VRDVTAGIYAVGSSYRRQRQVCFEERGPVPGNLSAGSVSKVSPTTKDASKIEGAHRDVKSDHVLGSKVLLEGIEDGYFIKVGVGGIRDDVGVDQTHDRVSRGMDGLCVCVGMVFLVR